MRNSFVLYTEYADHFEFMSMEQRGVLFTAIMSFERNEEMPEMDSAVTMAFSFIKKQLERDEEKYNETVQKRINAGVKSGEARRNKSEQARTKRTHVKCVEQSGTKRTVYVDDDVDVNDNDKEIKKKSLEHDADEMFDRLWERYPRKKGKTAVSKSQRIKLLKVGEDVLAGCLDRFLDDMQGRDIDYIPYGSTFFNSGYKDYLPEDGVVLVDVKPEKPPDKDPNDGLEKYDDSDPDAKKKHPFDEGWRVNDDGYWVNVNGTV